jgi:hypothetical protein
MKIKDIHLSYCSNIHAGESWDATFRNLKIYIPEVKKRLEHKGPFGIGLRLSQEASVVLERPDILQEFRDWLNQTNAYVFTLNCFPYGGFHRTKVKEQVHAPDWTTEARLAYTLRCFRILAQLLPEGVEGGISTSPLSYRHWFVSDLEKNEAFEKATTHLIAVAVELVRLQQETGKFLHLDIEPEPDGLLENSEELIRYFKEWLIPMGKTSLAKQLGISERVRFMGAVPHDDLPALFAAADIMALVSSSEGLANAWVEALACGTPIVASDVGGIRELMKNDAAGRIVAKDPQDIADAVRSILYNPPQPADVTANVQAFSWNENARQLADFFRTVSGRKD